MKHIQQFESFVSEDSQELINEDSNLTEEQRIVIVKDLMIDGKSAKKIAGVIVKRKTGFTGYIYEYFKSTMPATSGFRSRESEVEKFGDTWYKTEKPNPDEKDCEKKLLDVINSIVIK